MSARKKHRMYLSPTDDGHLVKEIDRCTVKGRKSELLRNYAILGFQNAEAILRSNADPTAKSQELAKLFAGDDAPPDFRQAAAFIQAYAVYGGQAQAAGAAAPAAEPARTPPPPTRPVETVSPAPQAVPVEPGPAAADADPDDDEAPADEAAPPVVPSARAAPKWGGLKGLVATASKPVQGSK